MKTKDIKKGISLIVLIITIIVVIILAAVVILTLSKSNPIESAKEARFKEDVRTFQDELALTVSKQYTTAGGHRDEKITTLDFDEIKEYIPSFSEKYRDKFIIQDDELRYTKQLDEKEKEYAQNLNVKERRVLPKEYQQVEYIESTGTQWIDTKFLPQGNIKYKYSADFKLEDFSKEKQTIMGNDTSDIRIDQNGYIDGQISLPYIGINRHLIVIEVQKSQNGKHRFIRSCDGLVFASGEWNYWVNINISIFTNLNYNNRISKAKIFSANIFNNDNIVRDFIPCYSTTTVTDVDGIERTKDTIGLYDTVEGKFYTNQGTGEFIAGPDVDE